MKASYYSQPEVYKLITEFKKPLVEVLTILAEPKKHCTLDKVRAFRRLYKKLYILDELPVPTKELVRTKNAKILIDIRDKYFEHEENRGRIKPLWAIWNFGIIVLDYDNAYGAGRIPYCVEELFKRKDDWEPRNPKRPGKQWQRPDMEPEVEAKKLVDRLYGN